MDISEWPYTEQVTATQYKPGTIMSTSCNNGYTDSHMYKLLSFCHHRSDLYWQKNNESNDVIHRRTKLPTFVHGLWRVSLGAQMSHLSIVSDSNWSVIWCGRHRATVALSTKSGQGTTCIWGLTTVHDQASRIQHYSIWVVQPHVTSQISVCALLPGLSVFTVRVHSQV